MKYGSVCSGIEAASIAWEPLGFEPAFFSEINKEACAVLRHRWPDVPLHGDFTSIQKGDYDDVDVVVGGTPCQDFSVAGLRKGIAGDRGVLTIEFVRLLYRLESTWFCFENVPGIFSSDGGRAFGMFIAAAAGYPAGHVFEPPAGGWRNSGIVEPHDENSFGLAWRVLDAQHYGVPQRRRRVIVIGYIGDWRPAAAVLFDAESLRWDSSPRRKTREEITGTIGARTTAGGGFGGDFETTGGLQVAHTLKGEGFDASEDGTGRGTPLIPDNAPSLDCRSGRSGGNSFATSGGLVPEISPAGPSSDGDGDGAPLIPVMNAIPILEAGARTGRSTDDVTCGHGIGDSGDPMFSLQAAKQHGIAIPIHDKATRHKGGGDTRNDDGSSNGFGVGSEGDPMPTLDTASHHAVAVFDPNQVTSKVNRSVPQAEVAHTLPATGNSPIAFSVHQNQQEEVRVGGISNTLNTNGNAPGRNAPLAFDCKASPSHSQNPGEISPTLRAMTNKDSRSNGGGQVAVALDLRNATRDPDKMDSVNRQGCGIGDDVSHTLSTGAKNGVGTGMAVRRLTPRECERLQGFPDDHTLVPNGKKPMADGPRYRLCGNSMATVMMHEVGRRIKLVHDLLEEMRHA